MIAKFLLAAALLATSATALAHDDRYGRVITVEPHFSISFGTRHHDGFRVLYESGGSRYWTHTHHHPGHVIVLPRHEHRVEHVYHYRDGGRDWDDRRHWRDDRRDWDDRHHDRGDRRHDRKHRHHRHHD